MRYRKVYGQSKITSCPFCQRQAMTENSQGLAVCLAHKEAILNDFKCICGQPLDLMKGKYGNYFNCMQCGNINFNKALEINEVKDVSKDLQEKSTSKNSTKNKNFKDYSLKKQKQDQIKKEAGITDDVEEEIVMPGDPRYF